MAKNYETQIMNRTIGRAGQEMFNDQKFLTLRRIKESLRLLFSPFSKFVYFLVGLTGLAGTTVIIFKVIHLPSISELSMVLIFGIVSLSLAVSHAAFHGFFDLKREDK
jgi:hypothetical protein